MRGIGTVYLCGNLGDGQAGMFEEPGSSPHADLPENVGKGYTTAGGDQLAHMRYAVTESLGQSA